MQFGNKWIGPFGEYVIPKAIMWLADEANKRSGFDSVQCEIATVQQFKRHSQSPGYRVIEEWGNWRDNEAEKEYNDGNRH